MRFANLQRHVKLVHKKVKDFKCQSCDFTTGLKSNLDRHLKTIHDNELVIDMEKEDSKEWIDDLKFKCEFCQDLFPSDLNLDEHIKTVHQNVNSLKIDENDCSTIEIGSVNKTSSLENIQSTPVGKKFQCQSCHKSFTRNTNLKKHVRKKHQNNITFEPYRANLSLKYDTFEWNLNPFQYQDEEKESSEDNSDQRSQCFQCDLCHFSTSYKSSLKNHVATIHIGSKDYKCDQCSFASCVKSELNRHVKRMHQNDLENIRPFLVGAMEEYLGQ